MLSLKILPNQNKINTKRVEKARSIHDGYRKCGAHVRVLSSIFANDNGKNEIQLGKKVNGEDE